MSMLNDPNTLWVLVRAQETIFSIESSQVHTISLMQETISHTPGSDSVNLGIIPFNGEALPVIDLRGLMGLQSMAAELEELYAMMDLRKTDHIQWVEELRRCAREHSEFCLATDPHNCAFGKWYYNYKPKNNSMLFHLKKIEEPHRKLHETALRVLSCSNHGDEEGARTILADETEVYKTNVVTLLEETKQAFSDNAHNMMVVVTEHGRSCGLLLDEVLAVETLDILPATNLLPGQKNSPRIAQRKGTQELVLILDSAHIWSNMPNQ